MMFVDDQADEDDDEEDGVRGALGRGDAYYKPEELDRKNRGLNLLEM